MASKQLVLLDSVHSAWRSSRALRLPSARKMQAISRGGVGWVGWIGWVSETQCVKKDLACLVIVYCKHKLGSSRYIKNVLHFGTFLGEKAEISLSHSLGRSMDVILLACWRGSVKDGNPNKPSNRMESKKVFASWLNLDGTRKWGGLKASYQWGIFNMSCTIPRMYLRLVNLLEEQTMLEYFKNCTMNQ